MTVPPTYIYRAQPFNLDLLVDDLIKFKRQYHLKWGVIAKMAGTTTSSIRSVRFKDAYPKVEVFLNVCILMKKDPMLYLGESTEAKPEL